MREDYYGENLRWFIGVVKDSAGDKNRVRVRIFGVHRMDDVEDVSDGDLPYAIVLYPTTGGQTSGGSMSHGLKNGTWVFGFFADGEDCQQPVVVGVFGGGVNSTSSLSTSAPGGDSTNLQNDVAYDTKNNQVVNVPGNSTEQKAYNLIRSMLEKTGKSSGDLHAQTCGIMGNISAESNFKISSYNPNDRGQPSFGLCQWRGDRRTELIRRYGNSPSLEQQIAYLFDELNGSEKKAFNRILAATDINKATEAMCFFERPACYKRGSIDTSHSTYKPRIAAAMRFYSSMQYTPPESVKTVGRGDR